MIEHLWIAAEVIAGGLLFGFGFGLGQYVAGAFLLLFHKRRAP